MKNLSVSIVVPACNEEANIGQLLKSLLEQSQGNFELQEIVVCSDGSTDNTVQVARGVESSLIKILDNSNRKGKVARMNELFEMCTTDILIQFDADVILKDANTVEQLIAPFIVNPEIDLVSGDHEAMKTRTFVERLAKFGDDVWEQAKSDLADASAYRCSGQIRAFSKRLYSQMRWPLEVGSSEDLYSYYFCIKNNFNFIYTPKAVVEFRLVTNIRDYVRQLARLVGVHKSMSDFFDEELIIQHETMSAKDKLRALVKQSLRTAPHVVVSYLVLHTITRTLAKFIRQKPVWDLASSSKVLK